MGSRDSVVPLLSEELGRKAPVLVVPFSLIFGSVDVKGDALVSGEIYSIMLRLRDKGYYILVDCHGSLASSAVALRASNIPYNGLTSDRQYGMLHDEERYAERIEAHCGWADVAVVIDEDIVRLKLAVELGAIAIQIQSGCVISQSASGCAKINTMAHKDAYPAAQRD